MNNNNYYKRTFAKKAEYKGIEFDSTMECDYAKFLDGQIIRYKGENIYHNPLKWEYESKEFELIPQQKYVDRTERDTTVKTIIRNKNHTLQRVIYTPDFYLPDYNLLVETKGFQFDDGLFRMRFRLFKHQFPNQPILLVTSHSEFMKLDEVLKNLKINKED